MKTQEPKMTEAKEILDTTVLEKTTKMVFSMMPRLAIGCWLLSSTMLVSALIGTSMSALGAEISKFDGYYSGGMVDLQGKEIGLLFAPTRKVFASSSRADFSSQKLLERIASEPADIRSKLDAAKSAAQAGICDVVGKGKATDGLCIVLLPKKETVVTRAGSRITMKTFISGSHTTLKDIESDFGPPTEKERFEGTILSALGFDGLVCWWQDVGAAINKDGAITHVLVRDLASSPIRRDTSPTPPKTTPIRPGAPPPAPPRPPPAPIRPIRP